MNKYTTKPIHICTEPNCNTPLRLDWQTWSGYPDSLNGVSGYWMATCDNKTCGMTGYTMALDEMLSMSDETREWYTSTNRHTVKAVLP